MRVPSSLVRGDSLGGVDYYVVVLFFMASRSEIEDHRAPAPMNYAEMRKLHNTSMNGNSDIWWINAGVIEALRPGDF